MSTPKPLKVEKIWSILDISRRRSAPVLYGGTAGWFEGAWRGCDLLCDRGACSAASGCDTKDAGRGTSHREPYIQPYAVDEEESGDL